MINLRKNSKNYKVIDSTGHLVRAFVYARQDNLKAAQMFKTINNRPDWLIKQL